MMSKKNWKRMMLRRVVVCSTAPLHLAAPRRKRHKLHNYTPTSFLERGELLLWGKLATPRGRALSILCKITPYSRDDRARRQHDDGDDIGFFLASSASVVEIFYDVVASTLRTQNSYLISHISHISHHDNKCCFDLNEMILSITSLD